MTSGISLCTIEGVLETPQSGCHSSMIMVPLSCTPQPKSWTNCRAPCSCTASASLAYCGMARFSQAEQPSKNEPLLIRWPACCSVMKSAAPPFARSRKNSM